MKKFFRCAAAALAAVLGLTGCTLPGQNTGTVNNNRDMLDSYSYTPPEEADSEESYKWLIQPSLTADNMIVFDGSTVDPNEEKSRMYMRYAVMRDNGMYGLVDYSGNTVIKAEYDDYYVCYCGEIVLVKIIDDREGLYEYCTIDQKTKEVVDKPLHTEEMKSAQYYWDDTSKKIFMIKNGEKNLTEYADKKAVPVTEAKVTLDDFGNYVAEVSEDARCGMAKQGELLTPLEYVDFYAAAFKSAGSCFMALKNEEGLWGYFDAEGNQRIDFLFDGDASAYNGKLCDDDSKMHPYLFNGEYIPVSVGGYYGYYDMYGECVVKVGEFEQVRPVCNGRAWVKKGDLWGVIQLGELVEESDPKDDSSSKAPVTSWTAPVTEPEYTIIGYDDYGNPIYSQYTPEYDPGYDPGYDPTEDPTYGYDPGYGEDPTYNDPEYTDPGYTDPGYTDPGYTDPEYTDPGITDPGDPNVVPEPMY